MIVRMSRVLPINRAAAAAAVKNLAPDFSQTFTFVSLELLGRSVDRSAGLRFAAWNRAAD